MTEETKAAAENIVNRLVHLSEETKKLYNAISQIDSEAYDLSYDAIHLRIMLETDEKEEEGK